MRSAERRLEADEATILVEADALADPAARAPAGPELVLEIGFGRAEVLIGLAEAEPHRSFLGVEVSRKRAHKAARRILRAGVENVRVVHATAEYLLERVLPAACVSVCWINFPDPWPKKRHHKRRLLRADTLRRLARVLEPGGVLHVATDHPGYAAWIAEAAARVGELENVHRPAPWSSVPPERPGTVYEREFLAEGRSIAYFEYRRGRPAEAPRVSEGSE